jgi:hypothetical protein
MNFSTLMEWKHGRWFVSLMDDYQIIAEMPLEDWLKLKIVRYAAQVITERQDLGIIGREMRSTAAPDQGGQNRSPAFLNSGPR